MRNWPAIHVKVYRKLAARVYSSERYAFDMMKIAEEDRELAREWDKHMSKKCPMSGLKYPILKHLQYFERHSKIMNKAKALRGALSKFKEDFEANKESFRSHLQIVKIYEAAEQETGITVTF